MSIAEETAAIVEKLPASMAQSVLDFARSLAAEHADQEWEKRLSTAHLRPKFRAFVEDARREVAAGKSVPMDMDKL